MIDLRYCRECGKLKAATAFYGKSRRCKECTKERQHNAYWKAKDAHETRA